MQYTLERTIALPRARVLELFDDPEHLPEWQPELVAFEPFEGKPGEVGAKSRLKYQMGKRQYEMVETVTQRELPEVFAGTYEGPGMWTQVINRFTEIDPGTTRWTLESDFRPQGLLMKLMAFLTPGRFQKHSAQMMDRFKTFAEARGPA